MGDATYWRALAKGYKARARIAEDELAECQRKLNMGKQHDSRLCPYCGRLMAFEGYERDYLTDRDSSAVWLCENPSCRAGLAEVRFPPDPDEYEDA